MTVKETQKLFNIKENVTLEELHQAYYNLLETYNPLLEQESKESLQEKYELINKAYELLMASKGINVSAFEERKKFFINCVSEYIHNISSYYKTIDSSILNSVLKYLIKIKVDANNCKNSLALESLIREFKNKMQEYAQIYFDKMVDQRVNTMTPAIYAIIIKYLEIIKEVPDIFKAHEIVEKMFKTIAVYYARYNDIRSMLDAIIEKYDINDYAKEKLPELEDKCLQKIAITLENGNIYPLYDEFEENLKRVVEIGKMTPSDVLNNFINGYKNYISALDLRDFEMKNRALAAEEILKLVIELLNNADKISIDREKLAIFQNFNWQDLDGFRKQLLDTFGQRLEFEYCDIYVSRDVPSFFYNGLIKVISSDNDNVSYVSAPDFLRAQTMSNKDLATKYISLKEFLLNSKFVGKSFHRTSITENRGNEFIEPESNYIMIYYGENGALLVNFKDEEPFCTISPEYLVDGKYTLKETDADLSAYVNKNDVYKQITDSINKKVSRYVTAQKK